MLERRAAGEFPSKPHTELRSPGGRLRYEECITRRGFDGPYSIVYHEGRPHEAMPRTLTELGLPELESAVAAVGTFARGAAAPGGSDPLLRRHFRSSALPPGGDPLRARRALLGNEDVALSVLRPDRALAAYSVNGDADELYFVHRGRGVLRSVFGDLAFEAGDYVCVPRGVLHRFLLEETEQFWLLIECAAPLEVPAQYRNCVGQIRMEAPYGHRDFRAPVFHPPRDEGFDALVVRRGGRLHGFSYGGSPLDVVGWDGALYPWAFSILDFQPKVGRVHLPPTVHGTFVTRGALVCSFVPRILDFGAGAIPCPYPHASVDIDEVIFYSRGDFGSRRGVEEGSVSYHPAGIAHGPHPGKYEASAEAAARHLAEGTRHATDELAVMLDCAQPLRATSAAESVEDRDYHASFVDSARTRAED